MSESTREAHKPQLNSLLDSGTQEAQPATDQPAREASSSRRWTEVLCTRCGGNGVIKIAHGVSSCPHCDGRCYEPEPAREAGVPEEPTDRPQDAQGRLMLNAYGRQCFDAGMKAGEPLLRAEIARLAQERDDWRLAFTTSNDHVLKLQRELEQVKQTVHEAHDLVYRPNQASNHDFGRCLIDGILNIQEGLALAASERDTTQAQLQALRTAVEGWGQMRAACDWCSRHPTMLCDPHERVLLRELSALLATGQEPKP